MDNERVQMGWDGDGQMSTLSERNTRNEPANAHPLNTHTKHKTRNGQANVHPPKHTQNTTQQKKWADKCPPSQKQTQNTTQNTTQTMSGQMSTLSKTDRKHNTNNGRADVHPLKNTQHKKWMGKCRPSQKHTT